MTRSDYDGLGHYRTEQATAAGFPGATTRTSFTNWNPGRSLANPPGPSDPWVLDVFDLRQVSEVGQTAVQELAFDADTGFLRRARTRAATDGTCGSTDVVVDRIQSTDPLFPGFLRREDVYGGDGQALACGDLSSLSLPAQPVFRRRHTYDCGVLAKTEILEPGSGPLTFLPLDRTIDCPSGLAASARDTAGLQTSYAYDALGRLTTESPQAGHGATSHLFFTRAIGLLAGPGPRPAEGRLDGPDRGGAPLQRLRPPRPGAPQAGRRHLRLPGDSLERERSRRPALGVGERGGPGALGHDPYW